jgi:hypothetical protein
MKNLLKNLFYISLILIYSYSHAESYNDITNFLYIIKLQNRYSIFDSYRQNQMDIIFANARFGLKYRYKNILGVIDVAAGGPSDAYTNMS